MNSVLRKCLHFLYGLVAIHLIWLVGTAYNDRIIPSPWLVYQHMDGAFFQSMVGHIHHSLWRLFAGIGLSLLGGLILGLLMARSKWISKVLNPLVYFLYPIPKMALLPVIMLLFGLGTPSAIAMIVLIIIFQVMINVRDGIASTSEAYYEASTVLGASKVRLFFEVTLPAAASPILSSARVALGTGTAILFITETHGTRYGLGFYIMNAWMRLDYVAMYAGIVVLSLVAFVLFIVLDLISGIVLKWEG